MDFWETLKVSTSASLWLSWIAMLIAAVLTFAIACSSRIHRRYYSLSGILGGVAGEFCAVNSLFIGRWLWCRGQNPCNTAQGDIALIYLLPLGTCSGCLLASCFTAMTLRVIQLSPSDRLFRRVTWTCSIAVQFAMFVSATWFFANLMA